MPLIPLNTGNFADAHWKPLTNSAFARPLNIIELLASEMPAAACTLPIGLVRNGEQGPWTLQAVLGVAQRGNLFVAADGSWLGGYWPLRLRLAPFALAQSETGEYVLCINDDWWQAPETGGYPFYSQGETLGEETAVVRKECETLATNHVRTQAACAALDAVGLIKPWHAVVKTAQGVVQLQGLHAIDESALNALSAQELQNLRDTGALAVAYCLLISMQHLTKLGELADAHAALNARITVAEVPDIDMSFLSKDGTIVLSN